MKINLHIERLIVDDFSIQRQQRDELKAAVVAALKQQLVAQGTALWRQPHTRRSSVNAGSITAENSEGVGNLGQQIGDAVYRGVGQ